MGILEVSMVTGNVDLVAVDICDVGNPIPPRLRVWEHLQNNLQCNVGYYGMAEFCVRDLCCVGCPPQQLRVVLVLVLVVAGETA